MLEIRQILNFIRIVELGGFSRAAEVLHIAQPALSQQVKNLEATLQRQLLVRHSRGVQVTEAGSAFLVHARRVRDELAIARRAIAEVTGPAGSVSLGMTVSSNDLFFSSLIEAVHRDYPRVRLSVVEGTSSELFQKLHAGQLDMACVSTEMRSEFVCETLVEDEWALLSAKFNRPIKHELTLREVCEYPLVLPPRSSSMRMRLEQEAQKQNLELNVAVEVQSESLQRRLAQQGIGHTVIPYRTAIQPSDAVYLHTTPIVRPAFRSVMCLAYLPRRPLGLGATSVRNLLIEFSRQLHNSSRNVPECDHAPALIVASARGR